MKTICEMAYTAIVNLNIVPKKNVGIDDVVREDWGGMTRIVISEGDSMSEEGQLGTIAQTTTLRIDVYAKERDVARNVCMRAGTVVYTVFELLERRRSCGILAVMRGTNGMAVLVCCDENGNRIFEPADVEWLTHKSVRPLTRIYNAAKELNDISDEDEEELLKN